MPDFLVLIFLFAALVLGFYLGRFGNSSKKNPEGKTATKAKHPLLTQKRYFEGLTYLLKDEADEAIDSFVSDMEVSSQTLEVHLALGGLLRRKGEIDRAIKVHQNLLARPVLTQDQLQQVQFELARDFINAGLLDRAESLLSELAHAQRIAKTLRRQSLEKLIDIYRDAHDWLKAIDIADQLTTRKFAAQSDRWREAQAHFCCELAEEAQRRKDWQQTHHWLHSALVYDKDCVRASLMQASMDMREGKYPAAIAKLKQIPRQNSHLASEMIVPLVVCYQKLNEYEKLQKELSAYLQNTNDLIALRYLRQQQLTSVGPKDMLVYLRAYFKRHEVNDAAAILVDTLLAHTELYERFAPVLDTMLQPQSEYRCHNCGFVGNHLHWLCPSCKHWSSMRLSP